MKYKYFYDIVYNIVYKILDMHFVDDDNKDIIIEKTIECNEIEIYNPYNPINKIINKDNIEEILKTYGINESIHNIDNYRIAFVHKSYIKENQYNKELNNIKIIPKPDNCIELCEISNERFEYVGDSLLELSIKKYLFDRFPNKNEGFMTQKKIVLVKNETIGRIAIDIGLNKWFILSKYYESKNFRSNLKVLGGLFEAFLYALYHDFNEKYPKRYEYGYFIIKTFIKNIYETNIDWVALIQNDDNFKNILQVILQKEFKVTPKYIEIKSEKEYENEYDNEKHFNNKSFFHMGVYLCLSSTTNISTLSSFNNVRDIETHFAGKELNIEIFNSFKDIKDYYKKNNKLFLMLGEGKHNIKKDAEQIACKNAIDIINKWDNL
jgi:dsRNA-specific ribonuclease